MKFFVAIFFVLGCAVSAYAQSTSTLSYPYPGDGGTIDDNEDYIPDSVLCFVNIARDAQSQATPAGQQWLATGETASQSYDNALRGPNQFQQIATDSILLALRCFCNLDGEIEEPLNVYFKQVCAEFGPLLYEGNKRKINDYMIAAYSNFEGYIYSK